MAIGKTEYRQLVRTRVRDSIAAIHRNTASALCDQFTSITEAEGLDRWTFLPETLERAYEALTGSRPPRSVGETAEGEVIDASSIRDYAVAYEQLEVALERIFDSPKPDGV